MKPIMIFLLFTPFVWAMSVVDMFDREVTVAKSDKIIAVGPGALRLLTYMQVQNKLVGIENIELEFNYKSPYRRILNKEFIKSLDVIGQGGPSKMPNVEAIVKTKADVIFTSFLSKEQVKSLQEKSNIPVVALSYGSNYGGKAQLNKLDAIKQSLSLLGKIFQKQERADELIDFMNQNEILLSQLNLNKTAYIGGIGYKGAKGFNSTETNYPPFELLGIKNAVKLEKKGHSQIQLESLLLENPQMIFLDMLGKKIIKQNKDKNSALFQSIDAFKNKNVYWLYPYNFYNTNVENVYINAYIIAQKSGLELDIEKIKKQIYTKFLAKDIKSKLPQFNYE